MTTKAFDYSPVTVKTVYGTAAKGLLLVRTLEAGQVTKLYIYEDGAWIRIELDQVETIAIRDIDDVEIVDIYTDSIDNIELKPSDSDIIKNVVPTYSYMLDLT